MKKTAVISALAVIAVLAAVLTSFLRMRVAEQKMPHIVLPDAASAQDDPAEDVLNNIGRAPVPVEITNENVLRLIASMDRPKEYALEATVTLCWEDGESKTQSKVWRSGGLERVSYVENGISCQCIIAGQTTYIWEQGSQRYYTGATGAFTSDSAARLPAYEDLAQRKSSEVTACGTAEVDGANCLFVCTEEENGDLTREWYIDLENGLLRRMDEYRTGSLKYSVSATSITLGAVDASRFLLPDGQALTGVG